MISPKPRTAQSCQPSIRYSRRRNSTRSRTKRPLTGGNRENGGRYCRADLTSDHILIDLCSLRFLLFNLPGQVFAMPDLEIAIPRPQRWDVPFGSMTDTDIDRLLR